MKQKQVEQVQQGDVILRRTRAVSGGTVIGRGRCVLAEGEVTGHAHVVEDDEAELIRIGERMLLRLGRDATIRHEEHGPITLGPGTWEVGRVREYDYFAKMARPVMD